ncbi:MAG: hypothetical protein ACRCY9_20940, partial [Phycicoccus sp.]
PCEHCSGRGIVVSSEPVDKGGAGGGEAGSSRAGRGRRGSSAAAPEEPSRPSSGPTAAQIAAAAHAAAVRHSEPDGDPHETMPAEPAGTPEPAAVDQMSDVAADAAEDTPPAEVPERKKRRRGRVVAPAGPPRGDAEQATDRPDADPPEPEPAPVEVVEAPAGDVVTAPAPPIEVETAPALPTDVEAAPALPAEVEPPSSVGEASGPAPDGPPEQAGRTSDQADGETASSHEGREVSSEEIGSAERMSSTAAAEESA